MTFWAVAEAVAVDGKTSAAVAEAVAEGEGFDFQNLSKDMLGINLQRILAHISNQALFSITFYFFLSRGKRIRGAAFLSLNFFKNI